MVLCIVYINSMRKSSEELNSEKELQFTDYGKALRWITFKRQFTCRSKLTYWYYEKIVYFLHFYYHSNL